VLNGRRCLYGLDLERGTDVGERARTERKALWVVRLPPLVLCSQVECTRVLQVWWEHNGLIARLARQLDAQVPRVKGDKRKLVVLGENVFLCEVGESFNGIPKGASVADLVPGESG
jgi:hypothetical protein